MDNNTERSATFTEGAASATFTQESPYKDKAHPYTDNASRPYWMKYETEESLEQRKLSATKLIPSCLIFAIFLTFCIYKNLSGVTMPVFMIGTLCFMVYNLHLFGVEIKRSSWFYAFVILALSVSNFLTGDEFYLTFNIIGIFLLTFVFLLHNVYDDSKWNFAKTTASIIESIFTSLGCLGDFSKDKYVQKRFCDKTENKIPMKGSFRYILLGILISIPLVGILVTLLANADVVFKTFLTDYLEIDFEFGTLLGIMITFVVSYFASFCIMRYFSKKRIFEYVKDYRNFEPLIAITILSIVSVLYLVFSFVQIMGLFLGNLTLPEGYTYAQYAREGFFQLLAVSVINLLMVLLIKGIFRESKLLKFLMTLISLCTYIMIASSAMRMIMYITVYHLTLLRILVLWALAVLSLLFFGVIISIFKDSFPLFKYGVIIVSLFYVVLSFSHTDQIIAEYNLSNMKSFEVSEYDSEKDKNIYDRKDSSECDYIYLTGLSADAAPVISKYDEIWADDYFKNVSKKNYSKSWRKFNLSRYTAYTLGESR